MMISSGQILQINSTIKVLRQIKQYLVNWGQSRWTSRMKYIKVLLTGAFNLVESFQGSLNNGFIDMGSFRFPRIYSLLISGVEAYERTTD